MGGGAATDSDRGLKKPNEEYESDGKEHQNGD